MYEIGKVYIWQNITHKDFKYLNGQETIVLGPPREHVNGIDMKMAIGQDTDTIHKNGSKVMAGEGKLRPKNPPSGEKKIRDLFEPKPVMEPA